MDEPFAALDAATREDLQNLTIELQREQNLTLVVVTHNIEDAVFLGQKILVLGAAAAHRADHHRQSAGGRTRLSIAIRVF